MAQLTRPRISPTAELVGIDDIAKRLDVPRSTVSQWQFRGWPTNGAAVDRPQLLATISGYVPVYDWREVERWAMATGRA